MPSPMNRCGSGMDLDSNHDDHDHDKHINVTKKKRVAKACDSCRIKKTKCDGHKPCNRCSADNNICVFMRKKKNKEKHHAAGYVELLEARVDIVTKSLQKLVMLSSPHLSFLTELIQTQKSVTRVDTQQSQEHKEFALPINTLISCLIAEHGLLDNEPIDWDSGVTLAAGMSPNNVEASSRIFAEHNGKTFGDRLQYEEYSYNGNLFEPNDNSYKQSQNLHELNDYNLNQLNENNLNQLNENNLNKKNGNIKIEEEFFMQPNPHIRIAGSFSPPYSFAEEIYQREMSFAKLLRYPTVGEQEGHSHTNRPVSLFTSDSSSAASSRFEKTLSSSSTTSLNGKFEGVTLPYIASPKIIGGSPRVERHGHIIKPATHRRTGSGNRSPYATTPEGSYNKAFLFGQSNMSSLSLQKNESVGESDYEGRDVLMEMKLSNPDYEFNNSPSFFNTPGLMQPMMLQRVGEQRIRDGFFGQQGHDDFDYTKVGTKCSF